VPYNYEIEQVERFAAEVMPSFGPSKTGLET
jgi:hypothetical protein